MISMNRSDIAMDARAELAVRRDVAAINTAKANDRMLTRAIRRIRREIRQGRYLTQRKLWIAIDRMISLEFPMRDAQEGGGA